MLKEAVKKVSIIFVLALLFVGIGNIIEKQTSQATLIGEDPNEYNKLPWHAVGLVETSSSVGTGFLVGRGLVLTAAHVVCNDDGSMKSGKIWFYPNWHYMNRNLSENRIKSMAVEIDIGNYSYKDEKYNSKNDWAILQLDQPLGDHYGYLGVGFYENLEFYKHSYNIQHQIVGYPAENYWETENGSGNVLRIDSATPEEFDKDEGTFEFSSHSAPGNSGGPLFTWVKGGDQPFATGIYVGRTTYSDGTVKGLVKSLYPIKDKLNNRIETSKNWDYKYIGSTYEKKKIAFKNNGYNTYKVKITYRVEYSDGTEGYETSTYQLDPGESFYTNDSNSRQIKTKEVKAEATDQNNEKVNFGNIVVSSYNAYEMRTIQYVLGQTSADSYCVNENR